jgi:hypothetical protein
MSFIYTGIAHNYIALIMTLTVAIGNRKIHTHKLGKRVPFLHWEQGR